MSSCVRALSSVRCTSRRNERPRCDACERLVVITSAASSAARSRGGSRSSLNSSIVRNVNAVGARGAVEPRTSPAQAGDAFLNGTASGSNPFADARKPFRGTNAFAPARKLVMSAVSVGGPFRGRSSAHPDAALRPSREAQR